MSEVIQQPDDYDLQGFSTEEAVSLRWLQRQYAQNELPEQQETMVEYRRLEFARWMVEQGIISESIS